MRKILVFALVLVSVCLAAETWMGHTEKAVSALPRNLENPIPAVLPPAAGNDLPNIDTLKYDDNTAANAWAWNQAGNGFGVKFVRPANPVTLAGALIRLWDSSWPTPGDSSFEVKVYQADGSNGEPGTELWTSGTVTGRLGGWNYVPIGTPVLDYDFYIFYIQPDTYPHCAGLSIDAKSNSPGNTQWDMLGGGFAPSNRLGEWLIRAVYDWTPQTHNVGPVFYTTNLPFDTIPNVNINLAATFKNFGSTTENPGVPVRMRITGPMGYARDFTTDTTPGTWAYRGTKSVTFHPTWHVPDTAGEYVIKVWSAMPSDEYGGNDTMVRSLNAARWMTYADWTNPYWITWAGPERSQLINPADFGVDYPVQISRVRAMFYWHAQVPWDDSIFRYVLYAEDGTELWASDTVRAKHNQAMALDVTPPAILDAGQFYVAVRPRSVNGYPSSLGDNVVPPTPHSYSGDPASGWNPWTLGELFLAAAGRTYVPGAVGEDAASAAQARVSVRAQPNLGASPLISWELPRAGPMTIRLYNAAGQLVKTALTTTGSSARAGSFRLDTRDMADGIYVVKLATHGSSASAKLVLGH
jgi:hypothetical protein